MSDWHQLSLGCFKSAKKLLDERDDLFLRSCINRAYFSAYSAIAGSLPRGLKFPRGRRNPTHDQLPRLTKSHLRFQGRSMKQVLKGLYLLRSARETADYRHGHAIDRKLAVDCLRLAGYICKHTGVL